MKQCLKQGMAGHFGSMWNVLHAAVNGFSVCAIASTITRIFSVKSAVHAYREDSEVFVSFVYASQLEQLTMAFVSFVVFFTNMEFLRLLRFNRRVSLITSTMR